MAITYTTSAKKKLRGLDAKTAARIRAKISRLKNDPRTNVRKLVGRREFRLRVGAFRVLFQRDGDTITVLGIAPRGKAYR